MEKSGQTLPQVLCYRNGGAESTEKQDLAAEQLPPSQEMSQPASVTSRQRMAERMRVKNKLLRECMAEMLGTFILMVFGNGSVAQQTLSGSASGDYLTIYWAYGLGVTMAVYVAGGVSGAHINPAVSLANCVIGRMDWVKLPFYVLSQVIGAFTSAVVVFGIYYDALYAYTGGVRSVTGPNATAAIFATYPQDYLTITNGLFDQIFGTALLLCCILAINDERNNKPPKGLEPLLVGLLVFAIGNSYGTNCGYAINPARDFGPRLFTYMAGWNEAFTASTQDGISWWWVPIIGPLIGGVLGALTYLLVIELHWPVAKETQKSRPTADTGSPKREENDAAGNSDAENTLLMEQLHKF